MNLSPLEFLLSKEAFGVLSVVLTLVAYVPYIHSILKKQAEPHLFSWIVWTIVNVIAFAAQYSTGAGPGAWMAGFTALISLVVVAQAAVWGEKNITRSDWAAFLGSLLAILWWVFTKDPLGSVILVSLIDTVACYPTLRKSYAKPWAEPTFIYVMCAIRSGLSLFALEQVSWVTALYPVVMVFSNGLVAGVLFWRRTAIPRPA